MALPFIPLVAVGGAAYYFTSAADSIGEKIGSIFNVGDKTDDVSVSPSTISKEVQKNIVETIANPTGAEKVIYVDNRSSVLTVPGVPNWLKYGAVLIGGIYVWRKVK